MKQAVMLAVVLTLISCTSWKHPQGYGTDKLDADKAECERYSIDKMKEASSDMKKYSRQIQKQIVASAKKIKKQAFIECMTQKGWTKDGQTTPSE